MQSPPGAQIDKTSWLWYRKARRMLLDSTQLPRHVAIIMDGNGRWAQARGLPRVEGHRQGAKAVREVVRAAREIGVRALTLYAFSAQTGQRPAPEEINEERFAELLQTGELPPLDLLVRTSGEERLSNFLLWEAAYAELYFTDTYWPAFGKAELYQALESFRRRERRFGRTREQIRSVG